MTISTITLLRSASLSHSQNHPTSDTFGQLRYRIYHEVTRYTLSRLKQLAHWQGASDSKNLANKQIVDI